MRRTRSRYVTIARTDAGEISRIDGWEGGDFIQQGWDGVEQWATLNGEPLGVGYKDYDQVPYVSGDVQYWISLPYKLRDNGVNLHDRGMDDEGRHVVGVTFGEGIGLHDEEPESIGSNRAGRGPYRWRIWRRATWTGHDSASKTSAARTATSSSADAFTTTPKAP